MAEPLCMSCIHPECEYAGKDVRLFICLHEYTRKPPTNADGLRAMNDEELADYHAKMQLLGEYGVDSEKTELCKKLWLDWLQSPVGEVEDGD